MAPQGWRRVISNMLNACLEGALALDPGAYAAMWQIRSVDAVETDSIGVHRTGDRAAVQGGRRVATALQIATWS